MRMISEDEYDRMLKDRVRLEKAEASEQCAWVFAVLMAVVLTWGVCARLVFP